MTRIEQETTYPDGRPSAKLRMEARDQGMVLRHGDGPDRCDMLGAREALIFEEHGVYHLFYFTNHIGLDDPNWEYTDAIWVYWSKDLNRWDEKDKAVVLDGRNCMWSKKCIGMPSVIVVGKRLAIFYDAPGGNSTSHMGRDVGLAWLELPLSPPKQ